MRMLTSFVKEQPDRGIPILKTREENNFLKEQNFNLKTDLHYAKYREEESTALLSREVKDILEEFYALQLSKHDMEDKLEQFDELRKRADDAETARDKAESAAARAKKDLQDVDEKARKDVRQLEQRIADLEAELDNRQSPTCCGSCDDSLFSDQPQFCEQAERAINELKDKNWDERQTNGLLLNRIDDMNKEMDELRNQLTDALALVDKESAGGSKTFTMDNTDYIQRIDKLEAELSDQKDRYSTVIAFYMNKVSSLEKSLQKWEGTCDDSMLILHQFNVLESVDKEKMTHLVTNLRTKLSSERDRNRKLREECRRRLGSGPADDNSMLSENGDANETMDYRALLGVVGDKDRTHMLEKLRAANFNVDDSITDIPCEVDAVATAAELSTFSQPPGVHAEYEEGASPTKMPGNVSLVDEVAVLSGLQQSFRVAGTEIRVTQQNLLAVRQLLSDMFERLKCSAGLFQEVADYISDGSSPESKSLAARIREMQLVWANNIREGGNLSVAIEAAERSMVEMEQQIINMEASFNMSASFLFNMSRDRVSAGNMSNLLANLNNSIPANTQQQQQKESTTAEVEAKSADSAATAPIGSSTDAHHSSSIQQEQTNTDSCSHGGYQSVGGVTSSTVGELEQLVENLKRDVAAKEEQMAKLVQKLTDINNRCEEAGVARDTAIQTANVLRRQLTEEQISSSQRQMEHEQVLSELQSAEHHRAEAEQSLKEKMKHLEEALNLNAEIHIRLDESRAELNEKHAEWLNRENNLNQQITDLTCTRNQLADRATEYETSLRDAKEQLEELSQELQQKTTDLHKLAGELRAAQVISQNLTQNLDDIRRSVDDEKKEHKTLVNELQMERDVAKQNMDEMASRMLSMEALLESRRPSLPANEKTIELSMLARNGATKSRDCQTDMDSHAVQDIEREALTMSRDLATLNAAFGKLASAVSLFVNEEPLPEYKERVCSFGKPTASLSPRQSRLRVDAAAQEQKANLLIEQMRNSFDRRAQMAEMLKQHTDKLEKINQQQCGDGRSVAVANVAAPIYKRTTIEPSRYHYALRQNVYEMTVKSMDLVTNLKLVEKNRLSGCIYSIANIVEEMRSLRTSLNDLMSELSLNKENELPNSVDVLQKELSISKDQNKSMVRALQTLNNKFDHLRKNVPVKDTELLSRIEREMGKIHGVLGDATQLAAGSFPSGP